MRYVVFLLSSCGVFAQSLVVTGPLVDYAQNSHVRPMPFAATVAALPATGCTPEEMQYVISANSIYVNSTTGGCTWAALAGGSGGGGLQDPGANGPVFRSSLNVTRPSVAADIVGLFSGCVGSQYLGADGACHVPGGGGLPDPGSNGIVKRTAPNTTAIAVAGVDYAPPTSGTVPLKGNGAGGFAPALGTDIVTLFTGCSGIEYLGADGACHTLPVGGQYITGVTGQAIYIPATTHGQGINANASCYSGGVSTGATTGVQVICAITKDNLGNLTVSWGASSVGSIEVFSTGAGPQGPPGTGLADPGANGPIFRSSFDVTRAAIAADIVTLFAGCSGIEYLGADGACHSGGGGGGGATPYVVAASTSPQTISAGTHGQGINPIVQCFSGSISAAATTGNYVLCPYSKTSAGNVTVYYTSGEVGSIWVGSAGSGGGGGGGGTIAVTNLPLKGDNAGNAIAAAYGDIASLWSTCSGTQYLGFDGNCHTAGSLNSVALTVPAWLSVSGSPVTGSSGTFAVSAASGQTAHQVIGTCGSATTFGPCALVAGDIGPAGTLSNNTTGTALNVTGVVAAVNGGTGEAGTLTGVPKANGTSAYTLAAYGDIVGLWSGCSGTQYLGFDGTCHNPSGGGTVSSVGLLLPGTVFSISGSPVSTSGTLAGAFVNQTANTFFAGPCTGGAATPAFRGLCSTDIAALGTLTNNTSGNAATATALAATPTLCSTGQAPTGVLANGNATGCAAVGSGVASFNTRTGPVTLAAADVNAVGAITNSTSGNAATATALATTPTPCASGSAPTGVLTNGNSTGCTPYLGATAAVAGYLSGNMPSPWIYSDIRSRGAVCNGTDQNTAVQAALNAGLTAVYIPAGCTWVLPTSNWSYNPGGSGVRIVLANSVPGGINFTGENWQTSTIQTFNPTANGMLVGPGTIISNMNIQHSGCGPQDYQTGTYRYGTPCPMMNYANAGQQYKGTINSTTGAGVTYVQWQTGDKFLYDGGFSMNWAGQVIVIGGTAYTVGAIVTSGTSGPYSCTNGTPPSTYYATCLTINTTAVGNLTGASYYFDTYQPPNADGYQFLSMATRGPSDYNALQAGGFGGDTFYAGCNEPGCAAFRASNAGLSQNFYSQRLSNGTGYYSIDNAGVNGGFAYRTESTTRTGGTMMSFYQSTTNWNGNVIDMDIASGSGSYIGKFININNNLQTQFSVDQAGNTFTNTIQVAHGYTVASLTSALPCNSSREGMVVGVTDIQSPVLNATAVGGGGVHLPVYCNSAAWVIF